MRFITVTRKPAPPARKILKIRRRTTASTVRGTVAVFTAGGVSEMRSDNGNSREQWTAGERHLADRSQRNAHDPDGYNTVATRVCSGRPNDGHIVRCLAVFPGRAENTRFYWRVRLNFFPPHQHSFRPLLSPQLVSRGAEFLDRAMMSAASFERNSTNTAKWQTNCIFVNFHSNYGARFNRTSLKTLVL